MFFQLCVYNKKNELQSSKKKRENYKKIKPKNRKLKIGLFADLQRKKERKEKTKNKKQKCMHIKSEVF